MRKIDSIDGVTQGKAKICMTKVAVGMLVGSIILTGCSSEKLVQYNDTYCSLTYDTNAWKITEDYGESLNTTALTLEYKDDPSLCNVAFLAYPPDILTGEGWLNTVYSQVDEQFGCNNKTLSHTKNGDSTVTEMAFDYQNGDIITKMLGIAQTNDYGIVAALATINSNKDTTRLVNDIRKMCNTVNLKESPKNGDMLTPESSLAIKYLTLSDDSQCEVYSFRDGETEERPGYCSSVTDGLTSEYWIINSEEELTQESLVQSFMDYYAKEQQRFKDEGAFPVEADPVDATSVADSVYGKIVYYQSVGPVPGCEVIEKFTDASDYSVDSSESGSIANSSAEESSSSSAGGDDSPGLYKGYMILYRSTRLNSYDTLMWKLTMDADACTTESSNAAMELMSREGVQVTLSE